MVDIVVEKSGGGFGLAFDFPDAGVGQVIGFLVEGSDKGRAEPLQPVMGLRGEVAIVKGDEVGALMTAVTGFFGVFMAEPVGGEQVLPTLPAVVAELDSDSTSGPPVEGRAGDFMAETIPALQPDGVVVEKLLAEMAVKTREVDIQGGHGKTRSSLDFGAGRR